jgi:hypothetical protein
VTPKEPHEPKLKPFEAMQNELRGVYTDWIKALGLFPSHQRTAKLFGDWSFQDILAHFSAWNVITIQTIKAAFTGEEYTWEEDLDAFNARAVEERRGRTWEEIRHEFMETTWNLIVLYQNLPPNSWSKQYGPNPGNTLLDCLETDLKHFRDAHLPQVLERISQINRHSSES